jgi:L-lactate permease
MRLPVKTTPGLAALNSDDNNNSALLHIVLPILISIALLAVSLAILYAFLKHFRQKRKANATETNHQVVTVCIRTNKLKLTVSMQCWRHFLLPVILLFDRIYGPSFSSRLFVIYALSYTGPSKHGLGDATQKFPKFLCRRFTTYRNY